MVDILKFDTFNDKHIAGGKVFHKLTIFSDKNQNMHNSKATGLKVVTNEQSDIICLLTVRF